MKQAFKKMPSEDAERLINGFKEIVSRVTDSEGFMLLCLSGHPEGIQVSSLRGGELRPQLVLEWVSQSHKLAHRVVDAKLSKFAREDASNKTTN